MDSLNEWQLKLNQTLNIIYYNYIEEQWNKERENIKIMIQNYWKCEISSRNRNSFKWTDERNVKIINITYDQMLNIIYQTF